MLSRSAILLSALAAACGRPPGLVKAYLGGGDQVLYHETTAEKLVALTIDDGPFERTSPALLEVLDEHQASATFFVIGENAARHPHLLRDALARGHELGNHTFREIPSRSLPHPVFREDFLRTDSILRALGASPRWFRPGSGRFTEPMLELVTAHGYRAVLGDVYPFDPLIPSVAFATGFILHNVAPGSIIILHDGPARGERTREILSRVLPSLRARGYRFVTLSELARRREGRRGVENASSP